MSMQSHLKGRRFYSLEVLEEIPNKRINGSVAWKCKCDCGKIIEANTKQLNSDRKKSCGCTRYSKNKIKKRDKITGMSEKDAAEFAYLLKDFLEVPDACCKVMIDKLKNGEYETVIYFILKRKQLILKGEEN